MKEIYKDIPNYEKFYQVSNYGNVKSLERKIKNPIHEFIILKEKILKNRLSSSGYLHVYLSKNKEGKNFKVHQLVAMAFLDHKPCGHKIVVDHIDNNKLNNRLDNLQILDNRANVSKGYKAKNTSSEYIGVCWDKEKNKWQAEITVNGKQKYLGYFLEEEEAFKQYQKALKYINNNNLKEGDITAKELRDKLNELR